MGLQWMMGWLAWVGCGTETGNPEADASLLYNARSRLPEVSLEPGGGATIVSAVWLRLDAVRLVACEDTTTFSFDPLGLADHGGDEAFVQGAMVPGVEWCGLETAFVTGDEGDAITAGASVVIEGILADDRPFTVVIDEAVTIGLDLDAERPHEAWLLSFDVGTWIASEELVALSGDPVMVSRTENTGVYAAITGRLAEGVQLHEDLDVDGAIDDDERRLDRRSDR